jgi:hypothetical protein
MPVDKFLLKRFLFLSLRKAWLVALTLYPCNLVCLHKRACRCDGANIFEYFNKQDRLLLADKYTPLPFEVDIPLDCTALAEVLKRKSGAFDCRLDPSEGTFSFFFEGGWLTLRPCEVDNTSTVAWTGCDPIHVEKIYTAARYVWTLFMLAAFEKATRTGAVTLYARVKNTLSPFERIPADVWGGLKVIDWNGSVALDHGGIAYHLLVARHSP